MLLKNNSRFIDNPTYRLLIAMMLSLLLHLALLTKLGPSSQNRGSSNLLQVRLVTSAAPTKKITEPITANSSATADPQQEISSAIKTASPTSSPSSKTPLSKRNVARPASAPPPAQPAEAPRQVDQQPAIPLPDQNTPASWAEIEFNIFSGKDRKLLGTGLQHYEADGLGGYQLSFKEKLEPEIDTQNSSWQLEITGRIARNGLSPSDYMRQGSLAKRLMALNNMPTDNVLPLNKPQIGRMPDGILDRQSLLFQFMFSPPTNAGGQLMLTDGEKFGAYNYHIEGMEIVDVKAQGAIRTLHVTLSGSEYADIIELWLAPDYRFLPVKVRCTYSNGEVIEQLASSINFR